MMAPTRLTLFLSAIAALWCGCSTAAAGASPAPPEFLDPRSPSWIPELDPRSLIWTMGRIFAIDLNKDGKIGEQLEQFELAEHAGGPPRQIEVQEPRLVAADAIVELKYRDPRTQQLLAALERAKEKWHKVGDVGGGWFGPVGVQTGDHYAVYLFKVSHGEKRTHRIQNQILGAAPLRTRQYPVDPPVLGGGFPARLPLPWYSPPTWDEIVREPWARRGTSGPTSRGEEEAAGQEMLEERNAVGGDSWDMWRSRSNIFLGARQV